jgi:DNA-binding MarR family transcriptional regulator
MSTEKNIYVDVWLISQLASRHVSEMMGDSPLTVDEFALYGLIADLGPLTSSDLVRATGMSPTTLSGLVRRCESRGEVQRTPNPHDARSMHLSLTPRGYEVYAQMVPSLIEGVTALVDELGQHHQPTRLALQDLDAALRRLRGIGSRPYRVAQPDHDGSSVSYTGVALDPDQQREVRSFIDWIRARDGGMFRPQAAGDE